MRDLKAKPIEINVLPDGNAVDELGTKTSEQAHEAFIVSVAGFAIVVVELNARRIPLQIVEENGRRRNERQDAFVRNR